MNSGTTWEERSTTRPACLPVRAAGKRRLSAIADAVVIYRNWPRPSPNTGPAWLWP